MITLLLWIQSGVVPLFGPNHGQLMIWGFFAVSFVAAIVRTAIMRWTRARYPRWWVMFGLVCLWLLVFQLAATGLWEYKDWAQVARRLYQFSYIAMAIYIVASSVCSISSLKRSLYAITVVLAVLDVVSIFAHRLMIYSAFSPFTDLSPTAVSSGVTRFVPQGFGEVVFAVSLAVMDWIENGRWQAVSVVVCGLTVVILTFTRSFIAGALLVWIAAALGSTGRRIGKWPLGRLVGVTLVVGCVIGAGLAVFPTYAGALITRVVQGVEHGSPYRRMELQQGTKDVETHPWEVLLLGLGTGTPYSSVMGDLANAAYSPNANYDMHNMYMWMLVDYGVGGLMLVGIGVYRYIASLRRLDIGSDQRRFVSAGLWLLVQALLEGIYGGAFFASAFAGVYVLLLACSVKVGELSD